MERDDNRQKSRWTMRAMEWDEPRARYPNLWHEGMPRHVLAFDSIASRLRLGDLIAVYSPECTRHPARSNRFVGLSRVVGLRRAERAGHAWIDLETAHRFDPPLAVERPPRRVFMCCDPGWPEQEVSLFRQVFDAAVAAGWLPGEDGAEPEREAALPGTVPSPRPRRPEPPPPATRPAPDERLFAGAAFSGDMRDPREHTWLAVVALHEDRLRVVRLTPTGRSGLQSSLRNPDRELMRAEAIGLGFPFGFPLVFAEMLLGGNFPEEGWWALAKRLEKMTWPEYLTALHEFRDSHGEIGRFADERAGAVSPLHRVGPDMGSRSYHGIRMIAEDRSRYAIRPFESAQGRPLVEVDPRGAARRIAPGADSAQAVVAGLEALARLPVAIGGPHHGSCLERRDALDAVVAARAAAVALLTCETDRTPEQLAPEHADRVRYEGWIYGLEEPG